MTATTNTNVMGKTLTGMKTKRTQAEYTREALQYSRQLFTPDV